MTYFSQIIFPPKQKEEIISVGSLLDLKFWLKYTSEFKQFMVCCPTCGFTYCYSRLTNHISFYEIEMAIKENPKYFTGEWIINCPKVKDHADILNALGN